ncbi:hypothetical protein IHE45_04G032500 [Dioscorea alata]|uniref:Uncharacterized protein n=1 Tax=Dioscorea alata TaxID=55571 RepID=A0ACB7WBL7_DIOAL|nr:hypothetical protein IHE45_04G032500 [Dioscorea alata]
MTFRRPLPTPRQPPPPPLPPPPLPPMSSGNPPPAKLAPLAPALLVHVLALPRRCTTAGPPAGRRTTRRPLSSPPRSIPQLPLSNPPLVAPIHVGARFFAQLFECFSALVED